MRNRNWKFKLGVYLIVTSIFLFISLPIFPFLNIENKIKISITTGVFIGAEILFWSGGLLVGKEMLTKYKSYFYPKNWFKRTDNRDGLE